MLLLQGEDRRDRLQEHWPSTPLRLGHRQDPWPWQHRHLPETPEAGRGRDQTRARDGAAAVRGRGNGAADTIPLAQLRADRVSVHNPEAAPWTNEADAGETRSLSEIGTRGPPSRHG